MNDFLRETYVHKCGCERQDQEFSILHESREGVALVVRPVCIETGTQLELVGTEKQ